MATNDFLNVLKEIRGTEAPGNAYTDGIYHDITIKTTEDDNATPRLGAGLYGSMKIMTESAMIIAPHTTAIDQLAAIEGALISLYADKLTLDSIYADKITLDSLYADKATLDSLYADKTTLDSLYLDKLTLDSIFADKATIDSLFADKDTLDSVYADKLTLDSLYADKAKLDSLYADKITLDRIHTSIANIDTVSASIASVDTVAASIVDVNNAEENANTAIDKALDAISAANEAEDINTKVHTLGVPADTTEFSAKHYRNKTSADMLTTEGYKDQALAALQSTVELFDTFDDRFLGAKQLTSVTLTLNTTDETVNTPLYKKVIGLTSGATGWIASSTFTTNTDVVLENVTGTFAVTENIDVVDDIGTVLGTTASGIDVVTANADKEPTTDNDGNPLVAGTIYYSIPTTEVKFYNGGTWDAPDTAAATSAQAASASAAAALISEGLADADATQTAADRVQTGLDVLATAADLAATNQDTIDTAADLALTNADVILTNADVITTGNNATAAQTAQGLSEDARDDSIVAQGLSEAARDASITAQGLSETAQGLSEDARDASQVAQGLSEDAKDASIIAQGLSEGAKDASVIAQGLSEDARDDSISAKNAAETALASVESVFDSFDDTYLGAKASDPTLDNDGEALQIGAVYFNTTEEEVRFYNGTVWERPEHSASTSAQEAATSAANSATSASQSATSATASANSASAANTSANNASTSETNAASSASAASTSATNAAASESTAEGHANDASVSEANAATSETNAATSETNAATSASTASTQATNSANSATASATSATNSANSATAAASSASAASTSESNTLTSETNAAVSETNAASSESSASTSAATASAQANIATTKASEAATSESNATTSETNAATSESNASVSETNAASSASSASSSATTATTKASEALTSANNAATSESNASTSASNAASSEANASISEGHASTSATNSETSAQNALTSETNASNSASSASTSASNAATSASNASTSETNSASSATSAATDLATFQGQYSSSAAAPATPTEGGLWFDETANVMKVYDGSVWMNAGSSINGTSARFEFTATAGQTTFLTTGFDSGYADVYQNGIKLINTVDFNDTDGTNIVLTVGANLDDEISVIAYGTFLLADHYSKTVSDARYLQLTGGTVTGPITAPDFIGALNGAIQFEAKNTSGGTITKGQVISISGISGNTPTVTLADADNPATMPAFGLAGSTASDNETLEIVTFGSLKGVQTNYTGWALGDTLYISTTAGVLTNVPPTGEAAKIQNIGTVERLHSSNGTIKVGGAGRSNATPNLNDGNVFIGNASNQAAARALQIADTTGLQTALDGKAPLASPALTGTPTAPTAASNTNTNQVATTAYVQGELTDLIGGAPGALDTLNELAAAINDDASYASTVTSALGGKVATSSNQALSTAANAMTASGSTITLNRGDGTTDTVTVPDTNTTYSVGDGGLSEINFTSADHSKLNGIEAGATGDQTAAEILTAIKTVDGSGSGLDADLLDGLDSTAFVKMADYIDNRAIRQTYTATAGQTAFTVAGGYDGGFADVYLNGVKLVNGVDVDVSSGTGFTLTTGATVGSSVDFIGYGAFEVANTYERAEIDSLISNIDALPDQTGNAGKLLGTNGTTASWQQAGAVDDIFYENAQVITSNYTLATGRNAMTAGSITINDGVTITISDGSSWTIV